MIELNYIKDNSNRQIFTAYHEADPIKDQGKAVILALPFGHEFYKSYPFARKLAIKLAEAGIHVLRFDWLGHGDSEGYSQSFYFDEQISILASLKSYLLDSSGIDSASWIGMRLSSWLLMSAYQQNKIQTNQIISVDSLQSPEAFFDQWLQSQDLSSADPMRFPINRKGAQIASEIFGFLWNPDVYSHLLDLPNALKIENYPLTSVNSKTSTKSPLPFLTGHLNHIVNFTYDWDNYNNIESRLNSVVLMNALLEVITSNDN